MEQQPSVEICVSEAEPMRRGDDDPRCGTVLSLFSWFNSRRCSVCQFRGTCLLLGQNSNLFQNGFSEVSERAVGFGLQEESNTKCSWQVLRACWSLVARTCYLWKLVDIIWNCQQGYPVLEVFCLTGPHESWAQEATAEATGQEPSFLARMQCNGHRPMILSTVIFCAGLLALWRLDTGTLVGTQKFFTTFWGDVHRAAKIWKGQFPSRATLPAKWWQPDIVSLLVKYDFAILSSNAEEMLIEENGDQKYIQETKEMIAASFVSAHLFLVLARVASSCCYLFSSLKVWHLYYTSIYLPWTVSYESTIKADRVHVHWTRDTWIHPGHFVMRWRSAVSQKIAGCLFMRGLLDIHPQASLG